MSKDSPRTVQGRAGSSTALVVASQKTPRPSSSKLARGHGRAPAQRPQLTSPYIRMMQEEREKQEHVLEEVAGLLRAATKLSMDGDVFAAELEFRKALALEPENRTALDGCEVADSRRLEARTMLAMARQMESQRDHVGAFGAYHKTLELDPTCVAALDACDRLRMDPVVNAYSATLNAFQGGGSRHRKGTDHYNKDLASMIISLWQSGSSGTDMDTEPRKASVPSSRWKNAAQGARLQQARSASRSRACCGCRRADGGALCCDAYSTIGLAGCLSKRRLLRASERASLRQSERQSVLCDKLPPSIQHI